MKYTFLFFKTSYSNFIKLIILLWHLQRYSLKQDKNFFFDTRILWIRILQNHLEHTRSIFHIMSSVADCCPRALHLCQNILYFRNQSSAQVFSHLHFLLSKIYKFWFMKYDCRGVDYWVTANSRKLLKTIHLTVIFQHSYTLFLQIMLADAKFVGFFIYIKKKLK